MVCKASAPDAKMLCARALLAVRRAEDSGNAVLDQAAAAPAPCAEETAEVPETAPLLDRAGAVLIDWALAGLAAAPEPLEDRRCHAPLAARAAGLFRLSANLRRPAEAVRRRRDRDAEFAPAGTLRVASRAFALVEALRRSPWDPSLRGRARDAFDSIGDL